MLARHVDGFRVLVRSTADSVLVVLGKHEFTCSDVRDARGETGPKARSRSSDQLLRGSSSGFWHWIFD